MGKKIFTKTLEKSTTLGFGEVLSLSENLVAWLMEEDIEVIGFQLWVLSVHMSENDGHGRAYAILTQDANFAGTGRLGEVFSWNYWNTVPAFGLQQSQNIVVMFPTGHTIQVKEEGYLYLGVGLDLASVTAGNNTFTGAATIYYHKGAGTK